MINLLTGLLIWFIGLTTLYVRIPTLSPEAARGWPAEQSYVAILDCDPRPNMNCMTGTHVGNETLISPKISGLSPSFSQIDLKEGFKS